MNPSLATGIVPNNKNVGDKVLIKLTIFSLLVAIVPIGTYFGSLHYIWEGSTTWAAITAVLAANVVLVGYVYLAFREDAGDQRAAAAAAGGAAGAGSGAGAGAARGPSKSKKTQ